MLLIWGIIMPAINVDLVFVIDTSGSMAPCLEQLRKHLNELINPLQGFVSKIRFGLVAMSVAPSVGNSHNIYLLQLLSSYGAEAFSSIYSPSHNQNDSNEFFTDDPQKLSTILENLVPQGDENMLVALDIAADMPFGPLSNTKRVIALFSDESFEGGINGDANNYIIPQLIDKLQKRHIQLFVAIPDSDAVQQLSSADRSEIELVDGGQGLSGVDFKLLLSQMGKSISGSSLQSVAEPEYQRALFGQDKWVASGKRIDSSYKDN